MKKRRSRSKRGKTRSPRTRRHYRATDGFSSHELEWGGKYVDVVAKGDTAQTVRAILTTRCTDSTPYVWVLRIKVVGSPSFGIGRSEGLSRYIQNREGLFIFNCIGPILHLQLTTCDEETHHMYTTTAAPPIPHLCTWNGSIQLNERTVVKVKALNLLNTTAPRSAPLKHTHTPCWAVVVLGINVNPSVVQHEQDTESFSSGYPGTEVGMLPRDNMREGMAIFRIPRRTGFLLTLTIDGVRHMVQSIHPNDETLDRDAAYQAPYPQLPAAR